MMLPSADAAPPPPGGAYYSDAEVDDLCAGLTQDAAKVRFLRGLGLRVDRKPNGKPLAWRPAANSAAAQNESQQPSLGQNVAALHEWAARRKERSGQKA